MLVVVQEITQTQHIKVELTQLQIQVVVVVLAVLAVLA
jgi:hypothetical protein